MRIKKFITWFLAALWWLADKICGDVIFNWVKTMIDPHATVFPLREMQTWLPIVTFIAIGIYVSVPTSFWRSVKSFAHSKDATAGPETIARDTKMSEALAYFVTGKWGGSYFNIVSASEYENKALAPGEIRQAALDGDITVWGKTSNTPTSPYIEIRKSYWKKRGVEWFSSDKNECKTENESGQMGGEIYYDLMVSKTEIEKKWPPEA